MAGDLIQRVEIKNIKCLRHVTVDLEPLTVLIGKNDTGKSSFLDAVSHHARLLGKRGKHVSATGGLASLGATPKQASIELTFPSESIQFNLAQQTLAPGRNPLPNVQTPYRLNAGSLREPAMVGAIGHAPLPPDGSNLAAALDRLPTKRFVTLQSEFSSRIPTVEEIVFTYPKEGFKEVLFTVRGVGRLPARQMSDGAMLLLAYLTIIHDENAPKLIMIEEPENGIHPKQLEYVVKMLASLTQREDPIQVIMTTHSPYVLDFVPKESVRVFSRDEKGDVTVKPLHELRDVQDMLAEGMTLGEIWYNTDEDELVRGGG